MHGFIKFSWLAFTTIAFTKPARHQNSYHSKVSVSSLCFELVVPKLKQWENDTNQTCNILSTSCRCKTTIIERSVKAKVFILKGLGSRQFLGANMTLFMCLLHILEVELNQRNFQVKEGQGLVSPFSALDKKFPTTCGKWLGFFFTPGTPDRVLSVTDLGWKTPSGNDENFALLSANQWKRVQYVISTMVGSYCVSTIRHNLQSISN